jgi:hypothetical protein
VTDAAQLENRAASLSLRLPGTANLIDLLAEIYSKVP